MSRLQTLILPTLLASVGTAIVMSRSQIHAQNDVMLNPGALRWSSRGDLGDGRGEVLQGFHNSHWRGLGTRGKRCEITALRVANLQDAERRTPESYRWIVRAGNDAAGPLPGVPHEIFRSGSLSLGPALGAGSVAWNVTTSLRTPIVIPCTAFFAVGLALPARAGAGSHTDGLSVWIGAKLSGLDDNLAGPQASDQAWQIIGNAKQASHPSGKRVWRIGFQTKSPALQMGNLVAHSGSHALRFGSGGLFPAPGQGLAFRVHAQGQNGSFALLFVSGPRFSPGAFPIFASRFWLDLQNLQPSPLAIALVNKNTALAIPALKIPASLKGSLTWQALVLNLQTLQAELTNAVKTSL